MLVALACTGGEREVGLEPQVASSPSSTPTFSPTPAVKPSISAPSPASTVTLTSTSSPVAATSPADVPTPANVPLSSVHVERAFPNLSFPRMVHLTYADDGANRLFLALQAGRIMTLPNDQHADTASLFLDINERVNDAGNEEGLLGLAFDPDYRRNGYFYVHYSASGPRRSIVSRFSVSGNDPNVADAESERIILQVAQPYSNHNGGQLLFGPDGYLYAGLGDGGSRGDPGQNGQNTSTLLGSILRIDVDPVDSEDAYAIPSDNPFADQGEGVRGEVWAYGLRNPWRFTFDRVTGDLWAGDVGQYRFEEVNIIKSGGNYGWNVMEGFHCFQSPGDCNQEGLSQPLIEYDRGDGCSVTGGYVYRGARLPSLYGAYIYGDFCSGKIWALRYDGDQVSENLEIVDSSLTISAFGEDQSGELYILSFDDKVYRLTEP